MIEASCLRDADGDCLVVETDELAFRLALNELFFEERSGRHIRRFPAGTLTDGVFRRFELNSNRFSGRRRVSNLLRGKVRFGRRLVVSTALVSRGGLRAVLHLLSAGSL
jgi:hypothetical protein